MMLSAQYFTKIGCHLLAEGQFGELEKNPAPDLEVPSGYLYHEKKYLVHDAMPLEHGQEA